MSTKNETSLVKNENKTSENVKNVKSIFTNFNVLNEKSQFVKNFNILTFENVLSFVINFTEIYCHDLLKSLNLFLTSEKMNMKKTNFSVFSLLESEKNESELTNKLLKYDLTVNNKLVKFENKQSIITDVKNSLLNNSLISFDNETKKFFFDKNKVNKIDFESNIIKNYFYFTKQLIDSKKYFVFLDTLKDNVYSLKNNLKVFDVMKKEFLNKCKNENEKLLLKRNSIFVVTENDLLKENEIKFHSFSKNERESFKITHNLNRQTIDEKKVNELFELSSFEQISKQVSNILKIDKYNECIEKILS